MLVLISFSLVFISLQTEDETLDKLIQKQNASISKATSGVFQMETWAVPIDHPIEEYQKGQLTGRNLFKYQNGNLLIHYFGNDNEKGGPDDKIFLHNAEESAMILSSESGGWSIASLAIAEAKDPWIEKRLSYSRRPLKFAEVSSGIGSLEDLKQYEKVVVKKMQDGTTQVSFDKKNGIDPRVNVIRGVVNVNSDGDILNSNSVLLLNEEELKQDLKMTYIKGHTEFTQVYHFTGPSANGLAQQTNVKQIATEVDAAEFTLAHYGFDSQKPAGLFQRSSTWFAIFGVALVGIGVLLRSKIRTHD